ncbi:MAG TPA: DUF3108 domain-containing protein [Paludibacter sp.]|nr:DUF3108 domain-containing protein [Paludibacter sp.]
MNRYFGLLILAFLLFPFSLPAQYRLKMGLRRVAMGETLYYKASWGFLTIGNARTRIDKVLYKIGTHICYRIDVTGKTNGLARLFFVDDKWTSYIDTASLMTVKSACSIREGGYSLNEMIYFDHKNKKARVMRLDKNTGTYFLKNTYATPENIRDFVTGFFVFRYLNFQAYRNGDKFIVNGFYENEGYKIKVLYLGEEYIRTDFGRIKCYKVQPGVPKNRAFNSEDALTLWLSSDKSRKIMRIRASIFIGDVVVDIQK